HPQPAAHGVGTGGRKPGDILDLAEPHGPTVGQRRVLSVPRARLQAVPRDVRGLLHRRGLHARPDAELDQRWRVMRWHSSVLLQRTRTLARDDLVLGPVEGPRHY